MLYLLYYCLLCFMLGLALCFRYCFRVMLCYFRCFGLLFRLLYIIFFAHFLCLLCIRVNLSFFYFYFFFDEEKYINIYVPLKNVYIFINYPIIFFDCSIIYKVIIQIKLHLFQLRFRIHQLRIFQFSHYLMIRAFFCILGLNFYYFELIIPIILMLKNQIDYVHILGHLLFFLTILIQKKLNGLLILFSLYQNLLLYVKDRRLLRLCWLSLDELFLLFNHLVHHSNADSLHAI